MNLPEPGTEAVYRGLNVVVTTVKKRGRGYQVHYTTLDGQAHIAALTGGEAVRVEGTVMHRSNNDT